MTSELRPAVDVWTDAEMAACHGAEYAAAAVIEAYGDEREAKGREEQAAELAKFKALAETLKASAARWLDPAEMVIVVVGDKQKLEKPLKELHLPIYPLQLP